MSKVVTERVRAKLAEIPKAIAMCSKEASIYSHCVITKQSVAKNDCAKEFLLYKTCLQKAMSQMKL